MKTILPLLFIAASLTSCCTMKKNMNSNFKAKQEQHNKARHPKEIPTKF